MDKSGVDGFFHFKLNFGEKAEAFFFQTSGFRESEESNIFSAHDEWKMSYHK